MPYQDCLNRSSSFARTSKCRLQQSEITHAMLTAGFGEAEFYPDLMTKAAVLIDGIIRNHPFLDGNKRAGIAVAALFLRVNGFDLKTSNRDLELFTLDTTVRKPELSEIAAWFEQHCRKVS